MTSLSILDIFSEYSDNVLECIRIIEEYYDQEIVSGVKSGKIPRMGSIGTIEFKFHGAGCRVIDDNKWIDWDFPVVNGEVGIDPWKLWLFTREKPDRYGKFSSLEAIRFEVESLSKKGVVKKSELVGSNQYYII